MYVSFNIWTAPTYSSFDGGDTWRIVYTNIPEKVKINACAVSRDGSKMALGFTNQVVQTSSDVSGGLEFLRWSAQPGFFGDTLSLAASSDMVYLHATDEASIYAGRL
jgi:hypothetical protein